MDRCQVVYLPYRQCPYPVIGDEDICRWHRIMRVIRSRPHFPPPRWQIAMLVTGGMAVATTLYAYLHGHDQPIVLLAAAWALFLSLEFFCEGMIALDYTLSQLPWLARGFAWTTAICAAIGFTMAILVSTLGTDARPLLAQLGLTRTPWLRENAHLIVGPALASMSVMVVSRFVRVVIGRKVAYLSYATMLFVLACSAPLITTLGARAGITRETKDAFWEGALGENAATVSGLAFAIAVTICNIVNLVMRRANCTAAEFRATAGASWTACFFPPIAVMVAMAWIFRKTGYSSPVIFIGATVVLSIFICRWQTRMSIRAAQS